MSNRARAAGIGRPLPEEMNDASLKAILFPPKAKQDANKHPIDHKHVEREMGRRGMTMTLLWNEYCDSAISAGKEPYMYSAFCHRHRRWAASNRMSMHIDRKPAEQIQVDWALSIKTDKAHYQSFAVIGNCHPIRFPICSHRPSLSAYYR